MREVSYQQTEFRHPRKQQKLDLLSFVYDLPYPFIFGVFPPFEVLNDVLISGGGDGGMSPGAIWEPFRISADEYRELVDAVKNCRAPDEKARYFGGRHLSFDAEFDHYEKWDSWMDALSKKYG